MRYVDLVNRLAESRVLMTAKASMHTAARESNDEWDNNMLISKSNNVVYIRFNRPAKKNALTLEVVVVVLSAASFIIIIIVIIIDGFYMAFIQSKSFDRTKAQCSSKHHERE